LLKKYFLEISLEVYIGEKGPEIDEQLKGPTAVIFSYQDPVAYLKPLFAFAKKLELPTVKFALIEGAYTAAEKVKAISELPTREELLAKVVGGLNAPLSGFMNILRIYTTKQNRNKVEIAAKSILGNLK